MQRLKGLISLVFDAIAETTSLVERTHLAVARKSVDCFVPVEPASTAAQAVNELHGKVASGVYKSIHLVNQGAQKGFNLAADLVISQVEQSKRRNQGSFETPIDAHVPGSSRRFVDRAQSAINGLYGDHLHRDRSELSLGMTIRHAGDDLVMRTDTLADAFTNPGRKICVFVHGLGCTEWMWSNKYGRDNPKPGVNFGSRLETDCGYTPVFIRYNSGQHVSENGQSLSKLLSDLLTMFPKDIEEIIVVGHSMGGLVARSAAHYGNAHNEVWVSKLRHVFCIASPHLGSPVEKGVNLLAGILNTFNTAGTQVPASILNTRSAGIKDLRFGYTIDEEWAGNDPDSILDDNRQNIPLLDSVDYHFLAATITKDPTHPMGQLLGDLLVRVPSATGHSNAPDRRIPFRSNRVLSGKSHLKLANHPDVYDVIRQCIETA